jgi:hypothetical protein
VGVSVVPELGVVARVWGSLGAFRCVSASTWLHREAIIICYTLFVLNSVIFELYIIIFVTLSLTVDVIFELYVIICYTLFVINFLSSLMSYNYHI